MALPRSPDLTRALRPAWAEIDLNAIYDNTRALLGLLAPGTRFMAVVKADAYGHGAIEVGRAALEAGAWGAYLSGGGSAVLAFTTGAADAVGAAMVAAAAQHGAAGRYLCTRPRVCGAVPVKSIVNSVLPAAREIST